MEGIGPTLCIYAPIGNYRSTVKGRNGDAGTPCKGTRYKNREEKTDPVASNAMNEKGGSNPFGWSLLEAIVMKTWGKLLNIGTWNVITLYKPGKLDKLIQELNLMKIDIMGIAQTRWTDTGKIVKDDYTMIYFGGEDHKNGVGINLRNEVAKSLTGYWPISDRVVMVKLQAKPFEINMIHIYAPTQDYDDETIEEFYEQIQSAVSYTKSSDIICIMGI